MQLFAKIAAFSCQLLYFGKESSILDVRLCSKYTFATEEYVLAQKHHNAQNQLFVGASFGKFRKILMITHAPECFIKLPGRCYATSRTLFEFCEIFRTAYFCHRRCCIKKSKACNFIKKETVAQVFSCESCKIFKNFLFTEQLKTTAFIICRIFLQNF